MSKIKDSPEFKIALNKASEEAFNKFSKRKIKAVEKLSPSAEAYSEYATIKRIAYAKIRIGLICPVCGEDDHGNTMNGEPWCFKCNRALVDANKSRKEVRVKVLPKGYLPDILRGLPNKEEM